MRFLHVIQALYCEPWYISERMHKKLCEIMDAHISGAAHGEGGILSLFHEEDENSSHRFSAGSNIAVISIDGVIGKRVGSLARSSGVADVDIITRDVQAALHNDDIEGILLDVNSPGGTHTGCPECAEIIAQASVHKPVVAFTDKMMASAAFFLSAGADAIFATQTAIVGSIGTFIALLDSSRRNELQGLKTEVFKVGKFKGVGIPGTSLTKDQRQDLQDTVDKAFAEFSGFVVKHRGIPRAAMEGQTFTGQDAVDNLIVDAIGPVELAIEELHAIIQSRKHNDDDK